jgi:membrane-bound metal-dependent hydrolase YbcI (DUF457 family)
MFIGHAAVALAAKPLAPRVNLGVALVAAYWVDLVWPAFLLLGIEQVRIDPGNTAFTPLDFVHYPWTHSLVAAIAWGVLFALVFRMTSSQKGALVLGLLVFSHWLLDALSHRPDLPLWPEGGARIGLGLWNSVPATLAVELTMFAIGLAIYTRSAPARDRVGSLALWGLVGFLLLAYIGATFGPPPPNVAAIAITGIVSGPLFGFWAGWADRHRG